MQQAATRHFNPRARVGRDDSSDKYCKLYVISIHAPAWGATQSAKADIGYTVISIHAPAWGATFCILSVHPPGVISIHAPAWGATRLSGFQRFRALYFNPRARVGRDRF